MPADDNTGLRIDAMNLENRLRDVESDYGNRLLGLLLRIVEALLAFTSTALTCRVEEPSTASKADPGRAQAAAAAARRARHRAGVLRHLLAHLKRLEGRGAGIRVTALVSRI